MTKKYITIKKWLLVTKGLYSTANNDLRNGYKYNEYSNFCVTAETDKAYNTIIGWIPKSAVLTNETKNIDAIAKNETIRELELQLENENDTLEIAILKGMIRQKKEDLKKLMEE